MEERIARLEEKIDTLIKYLERKEHNYEKHNDYHYTTRQELIKLEAKQQGAWFVVSIFSAVIAFVSSLILSIFKE